MSEKMTDEMLRERYNSGCDGDKDAHLEVYVEARRARASEAEKDAVIKALADALEAARRCVAPETRTWDMAGAALRLAGRLP